MTKLIPLLVLAACTSSLDPATLIARDRVLGAKVSVEVDPSRAWPAPGERATITWLTASPGATPDFSWTLAACAAATTTGFPICAGPAFALSTHRGPVPMLELSVPSDMDAQAIAVIGAICASGAPVIDPATFAASCDDGSHADLVSQHIFLARDGATNHNPDLADAALLLGESPWDPSDAGCDGLPLIAPGTQDVVLAAEVAASSRETFSVDGDPMPWREELQLSPFATAGELTQRYAYVEADDDRPVSPVAVQWSAPAAADVPPGGLRVAFSFVLRDLRGGVDSATRALCVR